MFEIYYGVDLSRVLEFEFDGSAVDEVPIVRLRDEPVHVGSRANGDASIGRVAPPWKQAHGGSVL